MDLLLGFIIFIVLAVLTLQNIVGIKEHHLTV